MDDRSEMINLIFDDSNRTLLHHAVKSQNPEIVNLLIKHGADVNQVGSSGKMALHYAVKRDSFPIFQSLLVSKAKVNSRSYYKTVLHLAIERGTPHFIEHLLLCGADPNLQSLRGQTSLHIAILNNFDIASLLTYNADPNITDNNQQSPLHLAISQGHLKYTELLIKAGANPYKADRFGRTSLDCVRILDNNKLEHAMYIIILENMSLK